MKHLGFCWGMCLPNALILAILTTFFGACEKDDYALAPIPVIFHGSGFEGYYEADTVFSNGMNGTSVVKMTLSLSTPPSWSGFFHYQEINPTTGTTFSADLNIDNWNMNPTQDTLFLQIPVGSHQEEQTVFIGDGSSSQTVTVTDYKYLSMPFHRKSPGNYILEREFNGASQKFHLIKW